MGRQPVRDRYDAVVRVSLGEQPTKPYALVKETWSFAPRRASPRPAGALARRSERWRRRDQLRTGQRPVAAQGRHRRHRRGVSLGRRGSADPPRQRAITVGDRTKRVSAIRTAALMFRGGDAVDFSEAEPFESVPLTVQRIRRRRSALRRRDRAGLDGCPTALARSSGLVSAKPTWARLHRGPRGAGESDRTPPAARRSAQAIDAERSAGARSEELAPAAAPVVPRVEQPSPVSPARLRGRTPGTTCRVTCCSRRSSEATCDPSGEHLRRDIVDFHAAFFQEASHGMVFASLSPGTPIAVRWDARRLPRAPGSRSRGHPHPARGGEPARALPATPLALGHPAR